MHQVYITLDCSEVITSPQGLLVPGLLAKKRARVPERQEKKQGAGPQGSLGTQNGEMPPVNRELEGVTSAVTIHWKVPWDLGIAKPPSGLSSVPRYHHGQLLVVHWLPGKAGCANMPPPGYPHPQTMSAHILKARIVQVPVASGGGSSCSPFRPAMGEIPSLRPEPLKHGGQQDPVSPDFVGEDGLGNRAYVQKGGGG